LTIGAYRDDNGEPKVLNVVREAEKVIMEQNYNHEYLSQDGLPEFLTCAQQLMFGFNSRILSEGRVATIQAISGN
jgi:aspartate/tyrosine/aromatic aminotransferase